MSKIAYVYAFALYGGLLDCAVEFVTRRENSSAVRLFVFHFNSFFYLR